MFYALAGVDGEPIGLETPCTLLPSLSQKASMLRQALLSRLPIYMVPQYFIRLQRLPLQTSCKIDRRELRRLGAALLRERLNAYSGLGDGARDQETSLENSIKDERQAKHHEDPEAVLRKL